LDDQELREIFSDGESWPLHFDIRNFLRQEAIDLDKFLTDFSSAWKYEPHDERGVDDRIPESYARECYKLLNNGGKWSHSTSQTVTKDTSVVVSGVSISASGDGALTLQVGINTINIAPEDFNDFITYCQTVVAQARRGMPVPSTASAHIADQNYKATHDTSNPVRKTRMEQAMKDLERFAELSSKSYPRWQ
jgi:hypothetical protein